MKRIKCSQKLCDIHFIDLHIDSALTKIYLQKSNYKQKLSQIDKKTAKTVFQMRDSETLFKVEMSFTI